MARPPLEGIRVLDLTHFMAAPVATQLLGYLGAEVIKIESVQRMDLFRLNQVEKQDKMWEKSGVWLGNNLNKYGITLNLTDPQGRALFLDLVKAADIVIENFTPRVMKNFDLDYPTLREVNPTIVMFSVPGFGKTGPWRDYVGFAFTFEQLSGVAGLTGYPDSVPLNAMGADPLTAMHVAYATILALEHRHRTGRGQYVELAQLETPICVLGREVMEYSLNRRVEPRRGNRHPYLAPHGIYRCKGEDEWVAIAVGSDEEFQQLCEAMGSGAIDGDDRRFRTPIARLRHQDELDALIEAWTRTREKRKVMEVLQSRGIAAGALLTSADLHCDPHLGERGFFQDVSRELVGSVTYPTWAIRSEALPRTHNKPPPLLGQHGRFILGELLGQPESVLDALEERHVIGTEPLGM